MIEAVLSPEAIDRIVAATGKEPDDRERLAESIAETIHDYFANRGKFRLFAPDRIVDRALKQARKLQKLATEYYEIKDLIVVWINEENLRRRKTHAKVKRPERLWSHKEILTGWHLPLIYEKHFGLPAKRARDKDDERIVKGPAISFIMAVAKEGGSAARLGR